MTKFHLDTKKRTAPSPEATARYKDFGRLQADYKSTLARIHKPLYRDPKMLFALALVLLIVWLLLMEVGASEPAAEAVPTSIEQVDAEGHDAGQ